VATQRVGGRERPFAVQPVFCEHPRRPIVRYHLSCNFHLVIYSRPALRADFKAGAAQLVVFAQLHVNILMWNFNYVASR